MFYGREISGCIANEFLLLSSRFIEFANGVREELKPSS